MISRISVINYLSKNLLRDNNNVIKFLSAFNKEINTRYISHQLMKEKPQQECSTKFNSKMQQIFKSYVLSVINIQI